MIPSPPSSLRRLAEELRRLRENAGLKQEDAAHRAGIDRATLSKIENHRACPYASTLESLLTQYGVPEPERVPLRALRDASSPPRRTP